MRTILDTIVEHKKVEILKRKGKKPLEILKKAPNYKREPLDVVARFQKDRPSVIAEFKRKSPSKGIISNAISCESIVTAYRDGGAVASSILTDRDFFGGSFRDLESARSVVGDFPLLRKDFMIDAYQVHEAKAYGADIILLIAAILSPKTTKDLSELAVSLGLTVLLEVHNEEEAGHWNPAISLVGVNNRDLKNFNVDTELSVRLKPYLPQEAVLISESGLKNPSDVKMLYKAGYQGFLMGERFMKEADPGLALRDFISEL